MKQEGDKLIEKKDVRSNICRMMSEMLNNPYDCGVYPTTKFMNDMEDYINSLTALTSQEPYGWIVVTKDDYDYADNLSYVIKQREYSDYVEDFPLYRSPVPCDKDAEIERLRKQLYVDHYHDEGKGCPICEAFSERDALFQENEKLREVLEIITPTDLRQTADWIDRAYNWLSTSVSNKHKGGGDCQKLLRLLADKLETTLKGDNND